jgi:transcriptional regulator with XRE-family HTH domain
VKLTIYGLFVKKDTEKENVIELCKVLRKERLKQNLSQQRLSEMADISRTGLSHIESLETSPTLHSLLKISKVLEFDLSRFLKEQA